MERTGCGVAELGGTVARSSRSCGPAVGLDTAVLSSTQTVTVLWQNRGVPYRMQTWKWDLPSGNQTDQVLPQVGLPLE